MADEETYLFKIDSKFKILPIKDVKNFSNNEIFFIALAASKALEDQIISDAYKLKDNGSSYRGRNIATELEKSLKKLHEEFPYLEEQLSVYRKRKQPN